VFEAGLIRDAPAPELLYTMADPPNVAGASWSTGLWEVMALMQSGHVDLGFIGGAEVDRFGNLNTSYIGPPAEPTVKLPGSGGAADIASLARRFLIIMPHQRHRFVERVSFITSPGFGDGSNWRERVGLPGGGPAAIISTLSVFTFDPTSREAVLSSYHPFTTPQEVAENTGWPLQLAPNLRETTPPSHEELQIIRHYDPYGFWTGRQAV
jgi:glutaconate CoA-transferase subunit B